MKKIAIFQRDLGPGGIQKSILNLLNNINTEKYDIDLYLFNNKNFFEKKIPNNINIIHLKEKPLIFKFLPFKLLKLLIKTNIKTNYDLAIDFDGYNVSTALFASLVAAKKRVVWVHNNCEQKLKNEFKYRILWFFSKKKYIYFDTVITVSDGIIQPFLNSVKINEPKFKIITIPNIIDTNEIIEKSNEISPNIFSKTKYNLVTIGRISHAKGHDIMLNYIYEIKKTRSDIMLYIIGDGEYRRKIEKQIKKLKLEEHVKILGYITNPNPYLKASDGFIMTSRYEGQGMVILEAYVLGLDIFLEKHLLQYIPKLKNLHTNIVPDIIKAEKTKIKKPNFLTEYNNNIIKSIDLLFNDII